MKRTLQKLCSALLALIMLVGIVPAGILTASAESAPPIHILGFYRHDRGNTASGLDDRPGRS